MVTAWAVTAVVTGVTASLERHPSAVAEEWSPPGTVDGDRHGHSVAAGRGSERLPAQQPSLPDPRYLAAATPAVPAPLPEALPPVTVDPPPETPAEAEAPAPSEEPSAPQPAPPPSGRGSGVAGYPDSSTTGPWPDAPLTPSGSVTITEDGAVVEGLEITGTLTIEGNGVTVRNTVVHATSGIPVKVNGDGFVMEDSEIDGQGARGPAVAYNGYALRRVEIHHIGEGPRIAGNDVAIEDSYIHAIVQVGDNHTDAVQSTGGENILLRGNRIEVYDPETGSIGNAAFQFGEEDRSLRGCLVEGNLFNGGNFTINGGGGGTDGAQCVFADNAFLRDFRYGTHGNLGPNITWDATNTWFDTGAALP
jgi:hypothetical protein